MSTPSDISRRDFLARSGKAAGLVLFTAGAGFALHTPERHPFDEKEKKVALRDLRIPGMKAQMIVSHGEDPAAMTRACLAALGGMSAFVRKGDVVLVKPNIGWDRMPAQAANTNPDVVRVVVEECLAAGARKVIVTDVSCNDAERCFQRSGIAQSAEEAGAAVDRPKESAYVEVNLGGAMLGTQLVLRPFLEADKIINIPIAKHHSLTGATLGMKNLYGILGGNRSRLHQDINNSIADLANFLRPTLTILDAWRVLRRNGPQGGNLADVETRKTIAASTDPVALDAWAGETFFGFSADRLPYLALAEKYGLGSAAFSGIPIADITI
jgi:uncharacterized protein (DUF362 family)